MASFSDKSVLKQIYDTLSEDGTKVYFPGQHKGECIGKYIVIKMAGVSPILGISSERPIYDIMLYVPLNKYTQLETWAMEVKQKLKKLYPMIMYAGNETPDYVDDNVKAVMKSFQYYGIRKIEYMDF